MLRVVGPLLGAFLLLSACAATAPKQVAQEAPAPTCQGPSTDSLKQAMQDHGLKIAADYKGAEATAFNQFLKDHVVDKVPEVFDEIVVFTKDKIGVIVWFNAGCATSHAVGPYQLVEPFIGQSV